MKNKASFKRIYSLTWLALAISLVFLISFVGVNGSGDNNSLALWFILFITMMYLSAPLHGIVLIWSLFELVRGNGNALRWVYAYLIFAFFGHVIMAAYHGAFDDIQHGLVEFKRSIEEPEQVKLEIAFRSGSVSSIKDVRDALSTGANPNAGIFDNRMPFLVVAATKADMPVMKALLDAGADPNRRASIDFGVIGNPSALDVIAFSDEKGVLEGVKLLLSAGADPSHTIVKLGACSRGDLPLYNLAMTAGSNGLLDAKAQTCLHHAADKNRLKLLNALLFDPSYKRENARVFLGMSDHIGQYPLDVAVAGKHFEAAVLIAKAGGSANKDWTRQRVLENLANDPYLDELKTIILRDLSNRQE